MSITSMMANAAKLIERVEQDFLEGPKPNITIICQENGKTRMILEVIWPCDHSPREHKISA